MVADRFVTGKNTGFMPGESFCPVLYFLVLPTVPSMCFVFCGWLVNSGHMKEQMNEHEGFWWVSLSGALTAESEACQGVHCHY